MARRDWRYWEPTFQADRVCAMHPVWPWGGHRAFGYDLVRWMRPARIAELGVHWGTSFFTFAQAVKDGRMKETELIGVDTFEGEDHAGHYGPEVLETVQQIVRDHFPAQRITLHRMLFRNALAHVADESLDLLHIDGLHTYEAVKDDFETWLPKLAPEGIVLFHDVAPDTGYGSTDYWNEISAAHPSFAFEHSWGLGVLFPKGDSRLRELQRLGLEDKVLVYAHGARAERTLIELRDATRLAEERIAAIRKQSEIVRNRDQTIEQLRAHLAEAGRKAGEQSEQAGAAAKGLTARLEAAEQMARERFEIIQKQNEMVRNRDLTIERLGGELDGLRKLANERGESLRLARAEVQANAGLPARAAAAEAARDELRKRVADLQEQLRLHDRHLTEAREAQRVGARRIEELLAQVGAVRESLAAAAALQEAQTSIEARLAELAEHLSALVTSHDKARQLSAAELGRVRQSLEDARRAADAASAAVAQKLRRLDTDTELLSVRAEYLEEVFGAERERLAHDRAPPDAPLDWLTGESAAKRSRRTP